MNNIPLKLRLIYRPFLLTAVAVIGGYTLLNWLLFIKFQVFSLNEEIVNVWIPIILSFLCAFIWLQRRVNLMRLAGRANGFFSLMAGLAIGIPTVIAQLYMETAS